MKKRAENSATGHQCEARETCNHNLKTCYWNQGAGKTLRYHVSAGNVVRVPHLIGCQERKKLP